MPNPEVIRAQTSPEDASLFSVGLTNSAFLPEKHIAFSELIRQKLSIEKDNVKSGGELVFQFEKESTLLEDVDLLVTPSALAVAGGGTFIRYVDYLAPAVIKEITWKYGGNTIKSYTGDEIFESILRLEDEKRFNVDKLLLGNLTSASRNSYALNPTPIRIPIPSVWKDLLCHSAITCGLANKLQLSIRFQDVGLLIQTDGTKPSSVTFSDVHLDYQVIHTTGHLRSEIVSETLSPDGVSYLIDDQQVFNYDIEPNALGVGTKKTISLDDFDGPIRSMTVLIRTFDQLDPTSSNPAPYEIDTSFIEGMSYVIKSNGMDLVDQSVTEQDDIKQTDKFYKCKFTTECITWLWEEFPLAKNCASGSLTFGNFSNPRVILQNDSLGGVHPRLLITIIAHRHNWVVQQGGNYQKVWR